MVPDTSHTIDSLSSGDVRDRLLGTHCFQTWNEMRKVFSSRAQAKSGEWPGPELLASVRMILKSIGLRLTTKRSQGRNPGTQSRDNEKKHTINKDDIQAMQELLALKAGDAANAGKWASLLQSPPEVCGIVKAEAVNTVVAPDMSLI